MGEGGPVAPAEEAPAPPPVNPLLAFAVFQNCRRLQASAESLACKCQHVWQEATKELSLLKEDLVFLNDKFCNLPQPETNEGWGQQLQDLVPPWADRNIPVLRRLDEMHSGKNHKGESLPVLPDKELRQQVRGSRRVVCLHQGIRRVGGVSHQGRQPGGQSFQQLRPGR